MQLRWTCLVLGRHLCGRDHVATWTSPSESSRATPGSVKGLEDVPAPAPGDFVPPAHRGRCSFLRYVGPCPSSHVHASVNVRGGVERELSKGSDQQRIRA